MPLENAKIGFGEVGAVEADSRSRRGNEAGVWAVLVSVGDPTTSSGVGAASNGPDEVVGSPWLRPR